MSVRLGVRWTVGDVASAGFEALRLSVHGAMRLFGENCAYRIFINTISVPEARRRVGEVPSMVEWLPAPLEVPTVLRPFLGDDMAEGVAWKLMPLRALPGHFELSLDNDVILWNMPAAMEQWLHSGNPAAALIAEDVSAGHGKFSNVCGSAPRNSGIRGLGPEFDFEAAIARVLRVHPVPLESELDEQGLQVAALQLEGSLFVIEQKDVTICSPFYPHTPELGSSGAHFVGLNSRSLPWHYYGRPATEVRLEHWVSHRAELYRRIGLTLPLQGAA
jgi:hypothetical protein